MKHKYYTVRDLDHWLKNYPEKEGEVNPISHSVVYASKDIRIEVMDNRTDVIDIETGKRLGIIDLQGDTLKRNNKDGLFKNHHKTVDVIRDIVREMKKGIVTIDGDDLSKNSFTPPTLKALLDLEDVFDRAINRDTNCDKYYNDNKIVYFNEYNNILEIKDLCEKYLNNETIKAYMEPIIKERILKSLDETGINEQ
ncbi:hypothetical protein R4036_004582 [Salmonella enterica]|nr:hypothetical protein [Salmonella enterica]